MGATHAQRFAEEGFRVGCIDLRQDEVDATAAQIREAGGVAEAVVADVSDWGSMTTAADTLADKLGPVDVVLANAAIKFPGSYVHETDVSAWERVMAVNVTGPFITCKAALPQMRGRGG